MSDTSAYGIQGDGAQLHPAEIAAALHVRQTGRVEACATLVRLISRHFVEVSPVTVQTRGFLGKTRSRATCELRLVAGETSAHRHHGAPLVKQGHVEGLTRVDRALMELVFDRVAHSDRVTIREIDSFSTRHAWSYWRAIRTWRGIVKEVATEAALTGERRDRAKVSEVRELRHEVRRTIDALGLQNKPQTSHVSARLLELAVACGLDRRLARRLRAIQGHTAIHLGEPQLWFVLGDGRHRSPISAFGASMNPRHAPGPPSISTVTHPAGYTSGSGGGFLGRGGIGDG